MRLLLITKYFFPAGDAQSIQMTRLARAMASLGQEVRVIAGLEAREPQPAGSDTVHYVRYRNVNRHTSLIGRVFGRLRSETEACAPRTNWVRQATELASRMISESVPDAVITASSPFDSHMVGLNIRRKTGLPWAASFSDPWPSSLMPPPYNRYDIPVLSAWQLARLKSVLAQADAIHMPSKYAVELVQSRTGIAIADKSWSITHLSNEEFTAPVSTRGNGWLLHVGKLSRERCSRQLLEAVNIARSRIPGQFLGLQCIGNVCPEFRNMVSLMNLSGSVQVYGPVSVAEAQNRCAAAAALLVIEADMPLSPFLPSKFADYAASGRPIIAITPPVSCIRDCLRKAGGGYAVRHDVSEIAEAMVTVFSNPVSAPVPGPGTPATSLSKQFSPPAVASEYVKMLSSILQAEGRFHSNRAPSGGGNGAGLSTSLCCPIRRP